MNIIKDVEQGTDEWHDMRIGHITASRFKDVLSKGRGTAPSKTRLTYMRELVAELISGEKQESFSNEYMEWGTATEPQARAMYEFDTGNAVTEIAFCKLDNLKIGCSPDGLVGDDGGLEIKCPKTTTHIETVLSDEELFTRLSSGAIATANSMTWEKAADKMIDFIRDTLPLHTTTPR